MTLLRPALVAGLLAFCLVPPCAAQRPQAGSNLKSFPPPGPAPYSQRTDAFRRLLFEYHFQPLSDFAQLQANPSQSILILLGEPGFLSKGRFPQGLRSFVEQGGAVLIATDKETGGEAGQLLSELAGVRVTGETLICRRPNMNTADIYGGSMYCPIVHPAATTTALFDALATILNVGGPPDLFRNPRPGQPALRVAANAPSRLKTSAWWLPGGIHRLANLSRFCEEETHVLMRRPSPPLLEKNPESLFAVGGTLGKGRVLVLADHSIFINRMMLPRNLGNLEFTANCLHWLRGGVSTTRELLRAANDPQAAEKLIGRRDKVLFCDDGDIRIDFEVPLKKVSIKPSLEMIPALVASLDRTVARMEDEDFFNKTLRQKMNELPGGQPRVVRNTVLVLTLAAAVLLGYLFFWRGRHRHEPAVPLLAHAVSQHEPGASLLEQRRRALLRSGNVWEMAHQLARQCFETAGIPLTASSPPRLVMEGGWWQRWRVSQRVARLWKLARGDAPVRISPAALKRRLRDVEELKTALANETIQLT